MADYAENEEILQVYEDWGETEYLKEVIHVLDAYNPDWNKEKELGSWAAEFILDVLEETEEELEEWSREERCRRFEELTEERYEDFRSGHQFARINNLAIQAGNADGSGERIRQMSEEEAEKEGFPILV